MKKALKGHFFKTTFSYDAQHFTFEHETFQFPISFPHFKWRGFVGTESFDFNLDDKTLFFVNTGKFFGKQTIYVSNTGKYESIPTDEYELKNDDRDDLLYQNLPVDGENNIQVSSKTANDEYDADLYEYTQTIQIRGFQKEVMQDVLEILKQSPAVEANYDKVGKFSLSQNCLAYTEDWAIHVKARMFTDSEIDSTPIKHMAFFIKSRSFTGTEIYCGYHRQIDVKGVSEIATAKFYQWCGNRAPRLTKEGLMLKSSVWGNPFSLWRWIHPDIVTLTDDAILYTRKTFGKDEMVYLPYKRISMFLKSKGFLLTTFEIFGEQNIVPKYSFSKGNVDKISVFIKKNGVEEDYGSSYSSTIFLYKNWFGRAPKLVKIGNRLIFYPNRISKAIRQINKDSARVISMDMSEIDQVILYKKFFSLLGTIEIIGTSKSIRKDQDGKKVTIILPELFFSRSICGSLNVTGSSYSRVYEKYEI